MSSSSRASSLEAIGSFILSLHGGADALHALAGDVSTDVEGQLKRLLEEHFGPHFERLPRAAYALSTPEARLTDQPPEAREPGGASLALTEADVLAELSPQSRARFLSRSPEERRFILCAPKHLRAPYAAMSDEERTAMVRLKASEWNVYASMKPPERERFSRTDPLVRALLCALGPGFRMQLLADDAQALTALEAALLAEVAEHSAVPVNDQTRELLATVIGPRAKAPLRRHAEKVIANVLTESPGAVRLAKVIALNTLVHEAEFLDGVTEAARPLLVEAQQARPHPECDYVAQLLKARQSLAPLVLQLIHDTATFESITTGVAEAVIASAVFGAKVLGQKAPKKAAGELKFQRPIFV